ncbi:unnamed protein product [Penicillium manginii]
MPVELTKLEQIRQGCLNCSYIVLNGRYSQFKVDGIQVKSQTNENRRISFTTASNHVFEITFDCVAGNGVSVDLSERSFTGHMKPANSPNEPFPVTGNLYYPWEGELVRADGNKRSSVAGTARDSEGLKYFAVALDLVRKPSDVVIDDDRLRDVAPEQGPPMTETLMAYPLHEPPAGGSRKKKPKFRNSAITRHAVKLTLVMVSTAVGAGLGALLVSSKHLLDKKSVETMLAGAAFEAVNAHGVKDRHSADLANDTVKGLREKINETVWATLHKEVAKEFPFFYRLSKKEFHNGLVKGVNNWISRELSETTLKSDALETVERLINEKSRNSSPLELSAADLRDQMEKLDNEKRELIEYMTKSSKFPLPDQSDKRADKIKSLDRDLEEELEKIRASLVSDDLDTHAYVDGRLERMRERLKKIREQHDEEGHTHL